MSKRSDKMYKDSPTIKDEDGKKVVSKGEKKSAQVNAGTDGMEQHESHDEHMKLYQKHAKERLDLHHKHEKEHHEMLVKHLGDAGGAKKHEEKHEGGHEPKGKETHEEKKNTH